MIGDTKVLRKIVVFSKPGNCEGQMRQRVLSDKLEALLLKAKQQNEEEGEVSPKLFGQVKGVYAQIADLQ